MSRFGYSVKLILVAVLFFSSLAPMVEAQSGTAWIDLEIGSKYLFMGESLSITALTNASTIRILVVDPDESIIYNQVWGANETRSLPTGPGSPYGTYRIIGKVGASQSETWITFIDETGFSPANLPISKTINNVEYTIYSNWTLRGFNPNLGEMWIDFTALRDIVNEYEMSRTAYINEGSFLLRISGGAYAVDLRLIEVHDGLKLKINGTLSGARSFPIRFPQAERYLKNVLKSGGFMVDYSDLSGFTWDGENINGTVSGVFDWDPIIFISGFESGSLPGDGWDSNTTAGSGVIAVNSTASYTGDYGFYTSVQGVAGSKASTTKTFSGMSDFYVRAYHATLPSSDWLFLMNALSTSTTITSLRLDSSGEKFRIWAKNGTSNVLADLVYPIAENGTFLNIEMRVKIAGAYEGFVELWINDVLELNFTDLDTDNYGNIDEFRLGESGSTSADCVQYWDNVVIADSHIGPVVPVYYLEAGEVDVSPKVGGFNATISMSLETDSIPAFYWFSHNLSGVWVNLTAQAWTVNGTVEDWFWLPAQIGLSVGVRGYANTTDEVNASAIFTFVIVESEMWTQLLFGDGAILGFVVINAILLGLTVATRRGGLFSGLVGCLVFVFYLENISTNSFELWLPIAQIVACIFFFLSSDKL